MFEPVSVLIIMAGFATFGDRLIDLLVKLRTERDRRNKRAAQYFEALGACMSRVVEGLRANQIPRVDGHEFQELLHAFHKKTRGVGGVAAPKALRTSLDQAASIAKTLDAWILVGTPADPGDRDKMLAIVERIAGTCLGIAKELSDGD